MSSREKYNEYKARFETRYPRTRQDPKSQVITKIQRIRELREKLIDITVTDDNKEEVRDDLFAISMLSKALRDNFNGNKSAGRNEAVEAYKNANLKRINLWGGGVSQFQSKILDQDKESLTQKLARDSPLVNINFPDMLYDDSTGVDAGPLSKGDKTAETTTETTREEEEEKEEVKEAPKDIVEGDEGEVRVKTEAEIPATIDEEAVYVSEEAEETVNVPAGAPEEKKEEEPPAPPPLPTAVEADPVLSPISDEDDEPEISAISDEDITPPTEGERTETTPITTATTETQTTTTTPSNTTTQEFGLDIGTRTQPSIEGVLGGIDRGVLSSISTSRREGLSINKLKEDIKDFHKIYNNVIPAFKDKEHQKRKDKALKSNNKREVLQHYEEMENLIANYYKNDGGFKLGVIVSAESLFSGNIFGGNDLFATGMVGANSGITPIDRSSLERGGSTKYKKVVDIEPTYTRGGIDHALQKPVQNKEPKTKKGRVKLDRNIRTIPVSVHRPYQHILNRPLKPSYDIKIKGKK